MRKLSIGESDFRNLITKGFYYVDKSLIIKDIINDAATVLLLPRPRRFGKTLNLSMLRYFFEKNTEPNPNRALFNGLAIEKEPEFENHFGKYPVIFITLKDVKFSTWEKTLSRLKLLFQSLYSHYRYLLNLELTKEKADCFERILSLTATESEYSTSLQFLSELLYNYHNHKVIILIDEYDTPVHAAYYSTNEENKNFYTDCIEFLRSLLGTALKDNIYLDKAILTGILRVARESIFSGLNNLGIYTTLRNEYSDKFGFTEPEIQELIEYYGLQASEQIIKHWYNGYFFGNRVIYNPWSIINFINSEDKRPRPYWVNTSSNDIIKELIHNSPAGIKRDFELLLKNEAVESEIDENIVFNELKSNDKNIYSFLLFCGYLKAVESRIVDEEMLYKLYIPNREVHSVFRKIIENWFGTALESEKLRMLLKALLTGDTKLFEKILSEFVVNSLSYFDTQKRDVESVYQAFLLGLLVNLSSEYEVNSNRESGFGRYDIAIIPKDITKKAIIMELNRIDEYEEETKEQALDSALKQIEDKNYEAAIRERGCTDILKMAVTFDGKRVWVKT